MTPKILAFFILLLLALWCLNIGDYNMGWNPLNWQVTDTIQGQEGGFGLGGSVIGNYVQNTGQLNPGSATSVSNLSPSTTSQPTYEYPNFGGMNAGPIISTGTGQPVGSGGSGASKPAYSQEDMDYLNNQESLYNTLLGSLGGTLTSGLSKLDTSEAGARGSAKLSNDRAMRDYNLKREDSKRGKQDAIGNVDNNARSLSDSIRRILGMASGSGSSAYRFAAPNAIARDASKKRSSVMNSYGQNERNLDLAVDDTDVDYGNLLNEITNKRRTEEESLRAGILGQEQGIQQSLGEIAGERARLRGGNVLNASRPFQDRYLGIQNEIGALPNRFAVSNPREVKVTQPQLSDYLVDRTALNATQQSGQKQYSPYSAFLNKQRDDEEQLAVR